METVKRDPLCIIISSSPFVYIPAIPSIYSALHMLTGTEIRTEHKDVIHDVSYDYYGKRMATCSSDQTVKVRNTIFFAGKTKHAMTC